MVVGDRMEAENILEDSDLEILQMRENAEGSGRRGLKKRLIRGQQKSHGPLTIHRYWDAQSSHQQRLKLHCILVLDFYIELYYIDFLEDFP